MKVIYNIASVSIFMGNNYILRTDYLKCSFSYRGPYSEITSSRDLEQLMAQLLFYKIAEWETDN